MIPNHISNIQSSVEFETHVPRTTKRKQFSRHSKSKYRYKNNRKSHHNHRSERNSNAIKLKAEYQKRNNRHTDYDRSSFDTNLLLENRADKEMSLDPCAMVRDHLYISMLGLVCFLPTGIFGLIRAIQANKMKRPSSIVYWPKLAAVYGRHALRWAILSILIGTMLWTIFIIYHLLRKQHPLWDAYYQECGEQFLCSV